MPEEYKNVDPAEFDALMNTRVRIAEQEASSMLAKGVSSDIAVAHISRAVRDSEAERSRILAASATRQQQAAEQAAQAATAAAQAQAPPAATAPAQPPLAAPGTPPTHELPLIQQPGESLGAFWVRSGYRPNFTGGLGSAPAPGSNPNLDMSQHFGLTRRR